MGRPRNPNRDKSFEIFKEHNGKITSKEISKILGEKINNITNWRVQDKWYKRLNKVGAPFGNKNAINNKGGHAPKGNINHFTYGNYTKRIPMAVKNIMQELDIENPLEKLWRSICLQEARIIHMQDIMHVKDKNDMTKELKKISTGDKMSSEEYEIQFAWDKEANLISTQSTALNTLSKMLKQYDDMVHANWDTATEEQKLRVEKMKVSIDTTKQDIEARKEINNKKMQLDRERFEHQKKVDELKNF